MNLAVRLFLFLVCHAGARPLQWRRDYRSMTPFWRGGLLTVKMWAIVYSRWDVVEASFIPLKAIVVRPSCCGKFCSQNV